MTYRKYYYNLNVELSLIKHDDKTIELKLSDEGSGNTMSYILNKSDLEELLNDLNTEFILMDNGL